MLKYFRVVAALLFLIIFGLASIPYSKDKPPTTELPPILNKDGSWSNMELNLDLSGWRMITDETGHPQLLPPESLQSDLDQTLATNWSQVFTGNGLNGKVRSLVSLGANVYAGGYFSDAGGVSVNRIARWNGSNWLGMGSGVNSTVMALATDGTNIYAGGFFTQAGGKDINYVAKWDGSEWHALGTGENNGTDAAVYALAWIDGALYAGGDFANAGGVYTPYLAKWNGSNWSSIGSSLGNTVYAITGLDGDIYAGGYFTNHFAKWDGVSWTYPGSGTNNLVKALAVQEDDIIVAGQFLNAGSTPANYIARWDGSAWSALGSGTNGIIEALAVDGSTIYAGGLFTQAGGNPANYVAKWDGTSWSNLDSGTNSFIRDMALSFSNLYVGGDFTIAGGNTSEYIGLWGQAASTVQIKAFLEGAFRGSQMTTGLGSWIPTTSPYSQDPRTVTSLPASCVDWILVQLRETDGTTVAENRSLFLRTDGVIIDENGNSAHAFPGLPDDDYYIVVIHRNHLAAMSASPVSITGTTSVGWDFTTAGTQYYGTNGGKELVTGTWGLWCGDSDQDQTLDLDDYTQWRTEALVNGFGYSLYDLNFDTRITTLDYVYWINNYRTGITSQVP